MSEERIAIEVDGAGAEPDTVDTVKLAELAAAYFAALAKFAEANGKDLGLRGFGVVNKCAQVHAKTTDPAAARSYTHLLGAFAEGESALPEGRGLQGPAERFVRARQALPHEWNVVTRVGEWSEAVGSAPADDLPRARAKTLESLRVRIVDAGGDTKPRVRLASLSERKAFSLAVSREMAKQMGALLYEEVDVYFEAERDDDGDIREGRLIEFSLLDSAPPLDAWRKWFQDNCSHWNGVKDIEGELGRDR